MTKIASLVAALTLVAACEPAPETASSVQIERSLTEPSARKCSEGCGPSVPCSTPCHVDNGSGQNPEETTCGAKYPTSCKNTDTFVESNNSSASPSLPTATSGPGICAQARPWEVTFYQHKDYNAGHGPPVPTQGSLCRTFSVQRNGCAPAPWDEPWIENFGVGPDGFGFYNDELSSVSIGQNVVLTLFDDANFGGVTLLGRGTSGMGAVNMNLGSVQDRASSFKLTPNRPTRPLKLFWSAAREDNYSAGSEEGQANAAAASYANAGTLGYIETDKAGGALALYCYYNGALGDNLVTTSQNPPAGYAPCGLRAGSNSNVEGYIWHCGGANTVPLNLWYSAQRGDYHTVTPEFQSDAFLSSQGYVKQATLGRVLRAPR